MTDRSRPDAGFAHAPIDGTATVIRYSFGGWWAARHTIMGP